MDESIQRELDKFFAIQSWSSNTIDRYRRALSLFLDEIESPKDLDAAGFKRWLEAHPWGNSSQWIASNAVKAWLKWKYGYNHPALFLKLRREESPPQRTLKMGQVRKLLASFNTASRKGRRDLAIATLFLDTGLRVAEICALDLRYLDLEERTLRVIVKGGQWAFGVFSPYTASCLGSWLGDRKRSAKPGVKTVFVSVGGWNSGSSLTADGLKHEVRKWGKQAGIGELSPHDFRRTMATQATRQGAPQKVAMAAGRWKDPKVFEKYVRAIEPADIDPYSPVMAAMEVKK